MEQSRIEKFYKIIKESNEFDEDYYLSNYPEVNEENIDPIMHYITIGAKKMYNPSENFDTFYYLNNNADLLKHIKKVSPENFNPLVHYIQFGKKEGRETKIPIKYYGEKDEKLLLKQLAIEVKNQNKTIETINKELDSANTLINLLFSNFDVKAKGLLRLEQELCLELLRLVDEICKKNSLDYWLHAGTLLGAVRHGGYIPWDDDVDIAMMRKDFELFLDKFDEEISKNPFLKDNIRIDYYKFDENWKPNNYFVMLFAQVVLKKPLSKIDIFIFDFIEEDIDEKSFYKEYRKIKRQFIWEVKNNKYPPEVGLEKYNKILKTSKNNTNYIIRSLESHIKTQLFKSDVIFPLNQIKFDKYIFPCPNNLEAYISDLYGEDFMTIPKKIWVHDRIEKAGKQFSSKKDLELAYQKAILDLKNAIDITF